MAGFVTDLAGPAADAFVVTPSNDALDRAPRALYVGGGGDVDVTTVSGTRLVFSGVPGGFVVPVSVSHVHPTTTTATSIVGLV